MKTLVRTCPLREVSLFFYPKPRILKHSLSNTLSACTDHLSLSQTTRVLDILETVSRWQGTLRVYKPKQAITACDLSKQIAR